MNRTRFYLLASLASLVGCAWLALGFVREAGHHAGVQICLFKHFTGMPCPSCGSTRAILSLLHGDTGGIVHGNPLGLLLFTVLVAVPPWILHDVLSGKATLSGSFQGMDSLFKRKRFVIPAVALVLMNWAWNISKGL